MPAAAVIRERQALFVINGSKGYVGGIIDLLALTRKSGVYIIILESKGVTKTLRREY